MSNENEINSILEKCLKSNDDYNKFMGELFSELNSKYSSKKNEIENVKKNIKKLVQHLEELGKSSENQDLVQCLSCIFGSFLGDALGAYCEFKPANLNNVKYIFLGNPMFGDSPGQVTDDSEMAMSSAFGIMDNPNLLKLNSDYLYYYYGCWYLSHPRDIGFTTRSALNIFKATDFDPNKKNNYQKNFKYIKNKNNSSQANGFLMRTSPFIVWCYYRFKKKIEEAFNSSENEKLFELFHIIRIQAKKDNICTHPNDNLCIAHSCFCIMSLAAICGYNANQILDFEENLLTNDYFNKDGKDIKKMIMDEINQHKKDKNENEIMGNNLNQPEKGYHYFTKVKSVNKHMGYYVHAFRLTLYYLSYFDEINEENGLTKYRKIMNQICTYGGDTDTNAAIVGAVIGPLIGYKYFGDLEFKKMVELVPKNRYIFSPALMILYVYFLKESNNDGKIKNKMNFLRMILKVSYGEIDIEKLNKINLENKENNNNTKEKIQMNENEEEKDELKEEYKEQNKKKDEGVKVEEKKEEEKKEEVKKEEEKKEEEKHINEKEGTKNVKNDENNGENVKEIKKDGEEGKEEKEEKEKKEE